MGNGRQTTACVVCGQWSVVSGLKWVKNNPLTKTAGSRQQHFSGGMNRPQFIWR